MKMKKVGRIYDNISNGFVLLSSINIIFTFGLPSFKIGFWMAKILILGFILSYTGYIATTFVDGEEQV